MVDCSHAQTGKDYTKQPEVLADVVRQVDAGGSPLMGFMLESNLSAGNQPLRGGRDGLRLRRLDHRRLHRLGDDRAQPARRRGGARIPGRRVTMTATETPIWRAALSQDEIRDS